MATDPALLQLVQPRARAPIAVIIAIPGKDDERIVGQMIIRTDGSLVHYGDQSACIDALGVIARAQPSARPETAP